MLHGRWRDFLHTRFVEQPEPLISYGDTLVPAASIWTGSRNWVQLLRAHELQPGERVILALPRSPEWIQVFIACIWENLTIALAEPHEDLVQLASTLDARLTVAPQAAAHTVTPDGIAGPDRSAAIEARPAGATTEAARILIRTSGTTGEPKWVALSDYNLFSVLDAHRDELALDGAIVLSVLPWSHAFGLVLDLLPAIESASQIVIDPDNGRDPDQLRALIRSHSVTHLSAVPVQFSRLRRRADGDQIIHALKGGIVGGAPISAPLAQALSGSQLRVGYGMTEASPGICLGTIGHFEAALIGETIGCAVRTDDAGQLLFRGPNACCGYWVDGQLRLADPRRWVPTGDFVRRTKAGLLFHAGRCDDKFKLANGRWVHAGLLEAKLRSRLSQIEDALVTTTDGEGLDVALLCEVPPLGEAREQLIASVGALVPTRPRVSIHTQDTWQATRKGTVEREAMTVQLAAESIDVAPTADPAIDNATSSELATEASV